MLRFYPCFDLWDLSKGKGLFVLLVPTKSLTQEMISWDYLVRPQHQYVWAENSVAAFLMRLMIECFDTTPVSLCCINQLQGSTCGELVWRSKRQISSAEHSIFNISDGNNKRRRNDPNIVEICAVQQKTNLSHLVHLSRWEHPMPEEWLPLKLRTIHPFAEIWMAQKSCWI